MYQFVKAIGISRAFGSQWAAVDLLNVPFKEIFTLYSKVFLTLTAAFQAEPLVVDLDSLKDDYASFNGTLADLLVVLETRTLTGSDYVPSGYVNYAKYSDAIRSGYKIGLTSIGMHLPDNYPISDMPDLVLTRPKFNTDLSLIHKHCLVSVNGFIHRTDTDGTAAFVYDGGVTHRLSKKNQLGILSFFNIGAVKQVAIDVDSVHSPNDTTTLYQRTYFSIEGDLKGKSIILVLGGYLVFLEPGVFWQTGDNSFALNFDAIPLLARYFESKEYIDLSSLTMPINTENPDMIHVPTVFSDEVIKQYLALSQTFVAVIDTPHLFTNTRAIRHSVLPGMFTTYQEPVYPLIVNYGKIADYWKVEEDGHWAITVQDKAFTNFVFTYSPVKSLVNITPNAKPDRTYYQTKGMLLEIGSYH